MSNKEIFERTAAYYDNEQRAQVAHVIAEAIRAEIGDVRGDFAMDYGCGTGLVGLELVDEFSSILFVDASPKMIEQVERKIQAAHYGNADVLASDFCLEEPPAIQVDCIFMAQVLLHVDDVSLLLSRLFALLREEGTLIVVDFDKNENVVSDKVHNGFTHDEMIGLVEQAGFTQANVHTFYHGEKLFMNEDASLFLMRACR